MSGLHAGKRSAQLRRVPEGSRGELSFGLQPFRFLNHAQIFSLENSVHMCERAFGNHDQKNLARTIAENLWNSPASIAQKFLSFVARTTRRSNRASHKAFEGVPNVEHFFAPVALQLYIRHLTGEIVRGLNLRGAKKSFANFSTQQNILC